MNLYLQNVKRYLRIFWPMQVAWQGGLTVQYNVNTYLVLFLPSNYPALPCPPSFLVCSFFFSIKKWDARCDIRLLNMTLISDIANVIWSVGGGISISHYIRIFLLIFLRGCHYLEKLLHIFCWLVLVLVKMTIFGVK